MRFLIDNALSPIVAERLHDLGHDAIHVRDVGMRAADDDLIFDFAAREERIIVSADTDFGFLLAARRTNKPSVLLFRGSSTHHPLRQIELLRAVLPQYDAELAAGAIVVLDGSRVRIHKLPLQ